MSKHIGIGMDMIQQDHIGIGIGISIGMIHSDRIGMVLSVESYCKWSICMSVSNRFMIGFDKSCDIIVHSQQRQKL